jgi:diguanylate cyclase (GGDEF)-like protein/PAS domain S-box-containing protein
VVPWRPDPDEEIKGVLCVSHDITARRAAEQREQAAGRALADALDVVDEVLFETDADGRWTALSPAFERATGIRVQDALGSSALDLVLPEDRAGYLERLSSLASSDSLEAAHRFRAADGSVRWAEVRLRVKRGPAGTVGGVAGTLADVTGRIEAQDALTDSERRARAAERRFEGAFASSPLAMAFLDAEGRFTKVNAACEDLWGHPEAELLGRSAPTMLAPDDAARFHRLTEELASGDGPDRLEQRWVDRRGTTVTTLSSVAALEGFDGHAAGIFMQFEDVTARRALEARLRQLADHDELTGLPNRRALRTALDRHLAHCLRYGADGAVLLIDLDGFKQINDTRGHAAGDAVLVAVAGALRHTLRATEHLARLGGDEFAVLLPKGDLDDAAVVAGKLRCAIEAMAGVRASIGATAGTPDARSTDRLIAAADEAMYRAKADGRGSGRLSGAQA